MPRKIFFFIKSLLLSSIIIGNLFATEISIIPLKKPILDKETQAAKIFHRVFLSLNQNPRKKEKKMKKQVKKEVKKEIISKKQTIGC